MFSEDTPQDMSNDFELDSLGNLMIYTGLTIVQYSLTMCPSLLWRMV